MGILALGIGGLSGLGAYCSPLLAPEQIYDVAMSAGFPSDVAVQMTAIALRESAGCPNASNIRAPRTTGPNDPGEESYGLWQINVGPNGNHALPSALGIKKQDLYDPYTNARAAHYLWGGSQRNLSIAWYIDRPGPPYYYKENYEKHLPTALSAAGQVTVAGSAPDSEVPPKDDSPTMVVLALAAAFSLLLLVQD
jgi:hypothetical protein